MSDGNYVAIRLRSVRACNEIIKESKGPSSFESKDNVSFATRSKRTARRQRVQTANGMIARAFLRRLDKEKVGK